MDKEKLFLREIDLGKLGLIYLPTVREILTIGQDIFYSLLLPFLCDEEDLENSKGINKYDFLTQGKELDRLYLALNFLYKPNEIKFADGIFMIVVKDITGQNGQRVTFINKNNFDDLCKVVRMTINYTGKEKEQKREVTIQNEENRAILEEYLRLQEQAKKEQEEQAKKNTISLSEMITLVASDCNWDYDRVLDMTYYRFINAYRMIITRDKNKISLKLNCSEKFQTQEGWSPEHWIESVRKDL